MKTPDIENLRIKPRFDGIFELRWDEDKKPKRRSTGTRCMKAAKVKAKTIETAIRAPRIPDMPTIGWILDRYVEGRALTIKEKNMPQLRYNVGSVRDRLGHLPWDQFSQDHVDAYAVDRLQDYDKRPGRGDRRIGPSTVSKDLRALRAALKDAAARRLVPNEVNFKINVTAAPAKDIWLTKDEVRRMIVCCEARQDRDENGRVSYRSRDRNHILGFILISLATAARKEAVLTLKWDQVHMPPGPLLDYSQGTTTEGAFGLATL